MNGRLVPVVARELLPVALALAGLVIPIASAQGARTNDARITRVSKEVKLLSATGGSRSASVNDRVSEGTEVVTGPDGQTELTFADRTLARLGGKTTFGFTQGVRQMELRSGAMLVRAPASAHGAEIRVAAATVAVTGTTCLLENNAGRYVKLVVLDGTARMFLKGRLGESVLVKEGQLLMFHLGPKLTSLPNPVDVDIKRLMATSKLIEGFAPIGTESSIDQGIADQKKQKTEGALVETNLVIYGRGTVVSLVDPSTAATPETSPSALRPTAVVARASARSRPAGH